VRALGWLGGVIAVLALLLKLFTYEFLLRDDATVGVALRSVPSLVSRQIVEHSPRPHLILVQSENDFLGSGLYESLVHWGWIVLVIAGIAMLLISRRNRPLSGRSGQAAS
jgi:hypothetical protein